MICIKTKQRDHNCHRKNIITTTKLNLMKCFIWKKQTKCNHTDWLTFITNESYSLKISNETKLEKQIKWIIIVFKSPNYGNVLWLEVQLKNPFGIP